MGRKGRGQGTTSQSYLSVACPLLHTSVVHVLLVSTVLCVSISVHAGVEGSSLSRQEGHNRTIIGSRIHDGMTIEKSSFILYR